MGDYLGGMDIMGSFGGTGGGEAFGPPATNLGMGAGAVEPPGGYADPMNAWYLEQERLRLALQQQAAFDNHLATQGQGMVGANGELIPPPPPAPPGAVAPTPVARPPAVTAPGPVQTGPVLPPVAANTTPPIVGGPGQPVPPGSSLQGIYDLPATPGAGDQRGLFQQAGDWFDRQFRSNDTAYRDARLTALGKPTGGSGSSLSSAMSAMSGAGRQMSQQAAPQGASVQPPQAQRITPASRGPQFPMVQGAMARRRQQRRPQQGGLLDG